MENTENVVNSVCHAFSLDLAKHMAVAPRLAITSKTMWHAWMTSGARWLALEYKARNYTPGQHAEPAEYMQHRVQTDDISVDYVFWYINPMFPYSLLNVIAQFDEYMDDNVLSIEKYDPFAHVMVGARFRGPKISVDFCARLWREMGRAANGYAAISRELGELREMFAVCEHTIEITTQLGLRLQVQCEWVYGDNGAMLSTDQRGYHRRWGPYLVGELTSSMADVRAYLASESFDSARYIPGVDLS
jgi:hypothetical protein